MIELLTTYTCGMGKKKILCLHGAGCNALYWKDICPPQGWQLLAVDLPGHGRSWEEPMNTIDEYARWVSALIDSIGEPVMLAGHSMGGAIAQSLALTNPQNILGLVLVCTGASLPVTPKLLNLCRQEDTSAITAFFAKYAYSRNIPREQIQKWQEELGTPASAVYLADFTACSGFDLRDKLADIKLPALVVYGTEDSMTPPEFAKFLAVQLPDAQLAEIPECGHMAILEQPVRLSQILSDFCERF